MYLIWALINSAFAILFLGLVLTLFTKGKKLFNNKYGNPIIVVLVLGVMGIINGNEKELKNDFTHYGKDLKSNEIRAFHTRMEENNSLVFHLDTRFAKNETGEFVPSYSRSSLSGFKSGFQWECKYIDIDPLEDGSFSYIASGVVRWSMFGIGIYTQTKDFNGTFTLPEY